jgi:hypothetical protein
MLQHSGKRESGYLNPPDAAFANMASHAPCQQFGKRRAGALFFGRFVEQIHYARCKHRGIREV